jgi:signal transduction histidine kinase
LGAVTQSSSTLAQAQGPCSSIALQGKFAEARLLIIDDNASNVTLLRAVFTRAGFQNIFTVMDPRLVKEGLGDWDPDLVILDLHMPHLDGFAVLDQIRLFAPVEALPVLVLTADTTSGASERALRCGAQDFVIKPFSNAEVLVRSQHLLRARFLYTTLRSSILRERAALAKERRLTTALETEQDEVDKLRFLDGLKDTLLQTVSHDLRNPIWSVMLMTDSLAADAQGIAPIPAELRLALIEKVQRSTEQMERLLTDILDSDPMRQGDQYPDLCNVGETVSRMLADIDLGPDHPVTTDIAPAMAKVDPAHLERIVTNLLSNARSHLAVGVPIWVRVAPQSGGVLISVDDAGDGVPPEIVATIFEPFRRGAHASSGGLGLGLSLVSRYAQLHGGRAWAENRPEGGASFRVFLPSA